MREFTMIRSARKTLGLIAVAAAAASFAACATSAAGTAAAPAAAAAPARADCSRFQPYLDSVHAGGRFAGATLGIAFADGSTCGLATGWNDTTAKSRMRPSDRLLSGSVGKTYVAAVALQLVGEGRLELDEKISTYLGREPWFSRLPNAHDVTVRMLMNHTSGLVRYELNERFLKDLTANPAKVWTPADRIAYLLDAPPPFRAGEGWDYSDTNYIVLGLIIERITGNQLNDEIRRRVLVPLALTHTVPSDQRRVPGLAQGYAGPNNPFGGFDAMIVNGEFVVNPQFEWAGGGYASTADDLARWMKLLFEGRAYPDTLLRQALDGKEARQLGQGAKYGLAAIIRETPLGTIYGHSGFMPGYVTEARYYPAQKFAVAFQVNSSAQGAVGRPPAAVAAEIARRLIEESR
jgi:D-alanyl-D-alanine carboxypeptidase